MLVWEGNTQTGGHAGLGKLNPGHSIQCSVASAVTPRVVVWGSLALYLPNMGLLASGLTAASSYDSFHIFLTLHEDLRCWNSATKTSGDKGGTWEMTTVGRRMLIKKFKGSDSDVEAPEANIQDSQIPAVELR